MFQLSCPTICRGIINNIYQMSISESSYSLSLLQRIASDSSSTLFACYRNYRFLRILTFDSIIPVHKRDALTHSFLQSQASNSNTLKRNILVSL